MHVETFLINTNSEIKPYYLSGITTMVSKQTQIPVWTLLVIALLILSISSEVEGRRVIFYGPQSIKIYTSQILSARAKEKPCIKCHMRDHRGICRRVLSFNNSEY